MDQNRLKKLLEYQKSEPSDPFILYAVATEYLQEEPLKAKDYFAELLTNHPDYLATYYHAAILYADLEMIDKADQVFRAGIGLAKKLNEQKALKELENAYQNFEFEHL